MRAALLDRCGPADLDFARDARVLQHAQIVMGRRACGRRRALLHGGRKLTHARPGLLTEPGACGRFGSAFQPPCVRGFLPQGIVGRPSAV